MSNEMPDEIWVDKSYFIKSGANKNPKVNGIAILMIEMQASILRVNSCLKANWLPSDIIKSAIPISPSPPQLEISK